MKPILLYGAIYLASFTQLNKSVSLQSKIQSTDTSRYVALKFDFQRDHYLFDKTDKPTTLSANEIAKIEAILNKRVLQYNEEIKQGLKKFNSNNQKQQPAKAIIYWNLIAEPSKYYKQLIAAVNAKGEKEVWVNCFCDTENKSYWKKDVVLVLDGGSCYFNLKINLTTGIVSHFMVNGVA